MKSEFALIELLRKKIPRKMQGSFGIGDDAAVLPGSAGEKLLFTTDVLVEGVDFIRGKTRARLVGRKALAVNLSDIAAMGATPHAFVISLGIPRKLSEKWILKFYGGMIALAKKYKVLCVGGDISRSRQFFASMAMIGRTRPGEVVTRGGARPGDLIAVTGRLGGSILGRHLRFEPRIPEARFLAARFHPTAMMDLSDGLWQDLGHILKGSGVGAKLALDKIPVSRDAFKLARGNSGAALRHALTDGEDFELLFTLPVVKKESLERAWKLRFPRLPLSWIGRIVAGAGPISCLRKGKPTAPPRLAKKGYSHF